jgi:ubiquinone/menaquinone biosynthesis C-methylase UbiE
VALIQGLMRNFDRVAKIYDSTRGLPDSVMKAVLDSFVVELRSSGTVLDAGVGTGRFAGPLKERGIDIVGLDVSEAMLSEAKRKSLTSLVRGELTTMPFADGVFDSCLMVHVLHLVENPAGLLSEIVRVCKSKLLSLAEESDNVGVRENYIKLRKEMGYHWSEISEQKLVTLVAPTELKDIISYSEETRTDDDIQYFRDRLSAVTWDVPDDVHKIIISRLSSTIGGRVYKSGRTIRLAIWDLGKIRSAGLLRT